MSACPMNVWNHTNGCDCAAKMTGAEQTAAFPGLAPGEYEALAAEAADYESSTVGQVKVGQTVLLDGDTHPFVARVINPTPDGRVEIGDEHGVIAVVPPTFPVGVMDPPPSAVPEAATSWRVQADQCSSDGPKFGPAVGKNGYHDPNWGQDDVIADWEATPGFVVMHDRMPKGTPPGWKGAHVSSANGTRWNVRAVPSGERYGRHPSYGLSTTGDMVIFYDASNATPDQPHGQMVSAYYLDTLDPSGDGKGMGGGLDLYGGEPAWQMDKASVEGVAGWARMALAK